MCGLALIFERFKMPEIIGQDSSVMKSVTHSNCGAILRYRESEVVTLWSGKDYSGGPDGAEGFVCPQCSEKVIIRRW